MDKDWKQWEREVAKDFETTRTGPLGSSMPDVITPLFSVECKLSKSPTVSVSAILQARRNAKAGTAWLVAQKQRRREGSRDCLKTVTMDYKTFVNLMKGTI